MALKLRTLLFVRFVVSLCIIFNGRGLHQKIDHKRSFFILNVSLLIKFQNLHVKKSVVLKATTGSRLHVAIPITKVLSDFRASLNNNKLPKLSHKIKFLKNSSTCHINLTVCFQNWSLQLTLKSKWSTAKIKVAIVN